MKEELLAMYERDNGITLTEEQRENFFEKTEPEKIAELFVPYYLEWGDTLQCNIIYNFETEKIEKRVGVEPYPDNYIEVLTCPPRWTRELNLTDLLNENEIEKYRWYAAGRRFDVSLNEYSVYDYNNDSVKIPEVSDFLNLKQEIEGNVIPLKERIENIVLWWLS